MTNKVNKDSDPIETKEWIEALDSVISNNSEERAHYLLEQLIDQARLRGINLPYKATTDYINTIKPKDEPPYPGDRELEQRIEALLRWNAMAMVVRGGKISSELGGHIASYASSATLYEVGFNHFFHRADETHGGDLVYTQGHSSPGLYARAYLEGRFTESNLEHFRQEIAYEDGLSSYPHSWLMPDFWQFATVSMGLGAIQGVYQARFLKYLENRELLDTSKRKVWVFCGDGEMDEPESLGAINIATKEGLDNLIFVINCNLQRLDGPVRGNSKIIQELEGIFRGAGWNVIKVIWDHHWDRLLEKDKEGVLRQCMMETIDGEYQSLKANHGAYMREHFFGKYPELLEMVSNLSDDELWHMEFGGHDAKKVYAAYQRAVNHKGTPTVILAKTIKGFGMGPVGQGKNTTHQQKKLAKEDVKYYQTRLNIPLSDEQIEKVVFYKPDDSSPEIQYLKEHRQQLGGSFPYRRQQESDKLIVPDLASFEKFLEAQEREISTTMVFVRILSALLKDPNIKERIVPIIPDECRTFGMEGLFRQIGIYSHVGQLYKPVDADQLMYYREDKKGQILEEGITEAGGFCSWMAAAVSYSTNNLPMIPFFIYYSMFGFQRIGDLAWAAGDMRARGFLLGGTAGRTTLAGEGLQHQDGHNLVMAGLIPNCVTYDPAFGFELAVIIQDGLRRMYHDQEDVYYYITLMNENYTHPAMPEGAEEGIRRGMYLLEENNEHKLKVQLLGSGTLVREAMKAAELLKEFNVSADIWSVTSFNELRKESTEIERWNFLHPEDEPMMNYVAQCLDHRQGPVIAVTDYVREYANQIRRFTNKPYFALGTDGYGRSDTREQLRYFFEVNSYYVALAALKQLADAGEIDSSMVTKAMKKFNIDPDKPNPVNV